MKKRALSTVLSIMLLCISFSRGLRLNRVPATTTATLSHRYTTTINRAISNKPMTRRVSVRPLLSASRLYSSYQYESILDLSPEGSKKPYAFRRKYTTSRPNDNDGVDYRVPVYIVDNKETALRALQILKAHSDHVWACDTEVADIDVKKEGPVGNGRVICASIYGGDDVDFGGGKTALWIKNDGEAEGVLNYFKEWFESDKYQKVWHNYGFDRHVMYNEGIDCRGFAGDTMHMARLWDSSRDKGSGGGDGYSLEALSSDSFLFPDTQAGKKFAKTKMKELFGVARLKKDGEESKIKELPDLRVLQNDPETRDQWIEYSARDAVATWCVRESVMRELRRMPWSVSGVTLPKVDGEKPNMYHFYMRYLKDFGELLTDMERNGIKLDTTGHLKKAEHAARLERQRMEDMFIEWATQYCADIKHINIASPAQMQQLLFGEYEDFELKSRERSFKQDKSPEEIEAERVAALAANPYAMHGAAELKALLKERGLKSTGKKDDQVTKLLQYDARYAELLASGAEAMSEACEARGLESAGSLEGMVRDYLRSEAQANAKGQAKLNREIRKQAKLAEESGYEFPTSDSVVAGETTGEVAIRAAVQNVTVPKKYREITITTIGLKPTDFTPTGQPQVSAAVLKKLSGKNVFGDEKEAVWGAAFEAFGGGEEGKRACRAIGALAAVGQIDATITNFLVPLQALVDKNNRIHCSLNLNTETGRLSSRRPNLQNQPALEKDQYKIRDAFVSEEGKTLIVADYGQLELRILAHISNCTSMIDAFKQGGCFHSRTAVGMYDYIKQAVEKGEVMLEWDYSKGQPTVPLVKDTYGSERRKAKTLNFSIAYGKTVHGLAQDWGISKEAAQETLDSWYRDRPEVKKWQEQTMYAARKNGWVNTIMGRYRKLLEAKGEPGPAVGHALRAAINTPIQGSAADIVMMAMIKLWKSETLRALGWKLLLQIHDEVILEGPKESLDQAMAEVRFCMENPFDDVLQRLRVHLDVDAKSADSWYKAK